MQVLQEANIPAFLTKLWKMVNDPKTDHLICWRECGNTFIIQNQAQFWYELLPLYYKHNNMSSFVRQLNMYGFHKVSSLENVGVADRDDTQSIQFYHPYFQREEPELLTKIKRKSPTAKPNDVQGVVGSDEINNVLREVKHLRGRQSSVDSQLCAMKQENSVLWRELALLRQKHVKQQQIVNKLIQFLATMVQPASPRRMGVVKRRMPLMLNENPAKKKKVRKNSLSRNDGGPTIHELNSEAELSPAQLLQEAVIEDSIPLIDSPSSQIAQDSLGSQPSPVASNVQSLPIETTFWDKPDVVTIEDAIEMSKNDEDINVQDNAGTSKKVFLNTDSDCEPLFGSLKSPAMYNVNASGRNTITNNRVNLSTSQDSLPTSTPDMRVATKNPKISNRGDLDLHLDSTQSELDELKDILDGCQTFDTNTLFGLFNVGESDPPVAPVLDKGNSIIEKGNPMVSGNEQAPTNNLLDFTELFDEDSQDVVILPDDPTPNTSSLPKIQSSSLDTPLIGKIEPTFPIV